MKENTKFILLAVLLVIIVALAAALYPKLSRQYQSENTVPAETKENTENAIGFTVYDTDGNAVSLSDMTGKPTVINFWATWCRYCVEELPIFHHYAKEYMDEINFMMVDLPDGYRETKEKALAFAKNEGYDFPIYFDSDGSASNAYQIQSIPMTLLIDRDGNLYKIHIGLMNEAALKQYIEILTDETNDNQ